MSKPVIGIDLGTTQCCVGVQVKNKIEIIANDLGDRTTPSYVAFTDTLRMIGDAAKNQAHRNPANTVFDTKRLIGRKYLDPTVQNDAKLWPFKVQSGPGDKAVINVRFQGKIRTFFPEEISAMILIKMKQVAGNFLKQQVKRAIITVPSTFNDSQRQATKDAGTIAGLEVLRIMNEPTAAAIAYGLDKKAKDEERILIFDLGGGTFDVSVLGLSDGVFDVQAHDGNAHLGGEDFDQQMVSYCCGEFLKKKGIDIRNNPRALRRLRTQCEKAKRILSSALQATIEVDALADNEDFNCTITRTKFEELCMPLFQKCISLVERVFEASYISKNQIHEVVLVGGSTRIPKIQELLKSFFGGKELNKSINPDEAVAYGAAVQGAFLTRYVNEQTKDFLVLDVTHLPLGIETDGGVMTVLIPRNTTLPTRKNKILTTSVDNQSQLLIEVFQGEGKLTKDCLKLGQFIIKGIAPAPKGVPEIQFHFLVDENGIVSIELDNEFSKKTNQITITNSNGNLSKDDIEKLKRQIEQWEIEEKQEELKVKFKQCQV